MTPSLTLDEQETHFNVVATNRSLVHVYSDDPVMQRKLEAVGAKVVRVSEDAGGGKHYELDSRQLLLRKVPNARKLTPAQKEALGRRLSKSTPK